MLLKMRKHKSVNNRRLVFMNWNACIATNYIGMHIVVALMQHAINLYFSAVNKTNWIEVYCVRSTFKWIVTCFETNNFLFTCVNEWTISIHVGTNNKKKFSHCNYWDVWLFALANPSRRVLGRASAISRVSVTALTPQRLILLQVHNSIQRVTLGDRVGVE